jgi:hypothetical protein
MEFLLIDFLVDSLHGPLSIYRHASLDHRYISSIFMCLGGGDGLVRCSLLSRPLCHVIPVLAIQNSRCLAQKFRDLRDDQNSQNLPFCICLFSFTGFDS